MDRQHHVNRIILLERELEIAMEQAASNGNVIDRGLYVERAEFLQLELLVVVEQMEKMFPDQPFPRHHQHHHRHHHGRIYNIFTFVISPFKFSSLMDSILSVPSGTPVTGFNAAGDAKGNDLGDSNYLAGSCVYAVIAGPSGNPPGFTVAAGAREEAFVVTEIGTAVASDGIITFNAKRKDSTDIPQSQGTLTFTQPVAIVTQNLFNFDQTSH